LKLRTLTLTPVGFKLNSLLKFALLLAFFGFTFITATAQTGDDDQDSDYYNSDYSSDYGGDDYSDSSYTDSDTAGYDDSDADYGSSYGGGGDDYVDGNYIVKPRVIVKKHVRFVPPYDSTRELVSYSGTVNVMDREDFEVEVDTIYHRAKNWMIAEFGEKQLKKMTAMDDINPNASEMEYKIKLKGTFPCVVDVNDFRKEENGDVEFNMEIRIREGRYRYRINKLVYVADPLSGENEGDRTYFEYFMKAEDNARNNDDILLAADKKINGMIETLREHCQKQPLEEDDDW